MARREGTGAVVKVRVLQHQLHGQVFPRLAAVTHHELQFREEPAHLIHMLHLLRKERHTRPGNADVDADGNIEVRAYRVEQVHLLVVDGYLRVRAARKHADGTDAKVAMNTPDVAHLVHTEVRVGRVIEDETVRILAFRRSRGRRAFEVADHGHIDAVTVHLADQELHVVVRAGQHRNVLEHVLGRHLELLPALFVHQQGLEGLVPLGVGLADGNAHHQVHHWNSLWHWHQPAPPNNRWRSCAFKTLPMRLRGSVSATARNSRGTL